MANINKIKARIQEMARRPNNVELSEVEWVVKQLGAHDYRTSVRKNVHQVLFNVNGRRFGACSHNPWQQPSQIVLRERVPGRHGGTWSI